MVGLPALWMPIVVSAVFVLVAFLSIHASGWHRGDMAALPGEATVLDALRAGRSLAEDAAVRLLMAFLFDYEQTRRPVGTLSGGERTRLAFLCLMQDAPNCLVLDEPTNHLDIDSIEALEDALERYDGTVIAVSHDRYFLDRIADRIVLVADGAVTAFEGGWSVNAETVRAAA
jgi:ATP-binding cassette subfamily F protein 3